MPPKQPPKPSVSTANPKKRKEPPTTTHKTGHPQAHKKHKPNDHRAKQRDARHLATQTTSRAFANGALDVDKFVQAREYEIRALEQGLRRSRGALNQRAFQQVPKDLRRRGAAHDVKRVVKRLRGRAGREMREDNTPTVNARARKRGLTGQKRLRLETVKKLRAMGAKRRSRGSEEDRVEVIDPNASAKAATALTSKSGDAARMAARAPKVKKATLAKPPIPKAKFRKRQKHKSWLPTHIFHAKRAHMTSPSAPMWKFALPLSPTQKSYRPTHRASSERGAVCWDTTYVSTIGLEGKESSVTGMLRALGVEERWLIGGKGKTWRAGTRVLETMVYEREKPHRLIAPVTIIWCVAQALSEDATDEASKLKRKLFLRAHPSAFLELWEEIIRLSKVAKPAVDVEDLRFELGSIELKGPGSTEALLGALWPSSSTDESEEYAAGSVQKTWIGLAGLTNAGMLPSGALLAFDVQDPKLHFPPRTVKLSNMMDEQTGLVELLADWPVDASQPPPMIFDRKARHSGSRLPSQKAINRRKSLAEPGEYAKQLPTDPRIPILLYASTPSSSNGKQHQSTSWHLLAPWKTIQPIWYSLMYYPLSTGQQPRFGGLNEQRQLAFEAGVPWFPGDFHGTKAGWEWEVMQRRKRWEDWKKRPKGKRVSWESVQVGEGKEGKGEVGVGWACDWEMLLDPSERALIPISRNEKGTSEQEVETTDGKDKDKKSQEEDASHPVPPPKPQDLTHISSTSALAIINNLITPLPSSVELQSRLLTVRLTLLTRGVPQTCARIYRLPSTMPNPDLRKSWLALHTSDQPSNKQKKDGLRRLPKDAPAHILQQRLAASLLARPKAGGAEYPTCPGQQDLVGFVTSGNFNLAEGKGTAVGCLLFDRVVEEATKGREGDGRMCIVRNAGESVGRLARWDVV